jgi:hypothetical protein
MYNEPAFELQSNDGMRAAAKKLFFSSFVVPFGPMKIQS